MLVLFDLGVAAVMGSMTVLPALAYGTSLLTEAA